MPTMSTDPSARRALEAAFFRMIERLGISLDEFLASVDSDGFALARALEGLDWDRDIAAPFREEWESQALVKHRAEFSGEAHKHAIEVFFDDEGHLPWSRAYIRTHGATMIQRINATTKAGIRELLDEALQNGVHSSVAARRVRPLIGLPPRFARAVERQRVLLTEQGLSPARVLKSTEAYSKRLLNLRARNIARSELITAGNQGHLDAWLVGMDQGVIDNGAHKTWIAGLDERTCAICNGLNGQQVPVRSPFYSEVLQKNLMRPTAHPSCRCTMALTFPRS